MDFESILNKWENRRDRGGNLKNGVPDDSGADEPSQKNWLEHYPPTKSAVGEKREDQPASKRHPKRLQPQDSVDLHGCTADEAREKLLFFLQSMRHRGLRKGLVIHGKGHHSPNGPVLLSLVREILETLPDVGEFGKAERKHGGSGATYFTLRQRSR